MVPPVFTGADMDKIKPLFTATATAVGGRNGHSEASDGSVKADLSVPKAMGGPGKPETTTPEHLFATGYAACFGGALDFVAKQQKQDATKARVTCAVSIGPREGGGFGLAVKMLVEDRSLAQAALDGLVREAHEKICPYSNATRGNVDVQFEVVGR
jgi:osmotically inducible protein OsmC